MTLADISPDAFRVARLEAAASLLAVPVLHDGRGDGALPHQRLQAPLERRASWGAAGRSGSRAGGKSSSRRSCRQITCQSLEADFLTSSAHRSTLCKTKKNWPVLNELYKFLLRANASLLRV
jgi:hypothetical protein